MDSTPQNHENMSAISNSLYEAAVSGSVPTLLDLIGRDALILEKVDTNGPSENNPLHVAALLGHVDFAKEILSRNPKLLGEVESRRFSPLHVASQKGHVEIVKAMIKVKPDMCLARDNEGRNPLHLAAVNGRVDVLVEILRARPLAAYANTVLGDSVLHLCVKYNQLESLRVLVEIMDDPNSLRARDEYGMSILHLAVAEKQIETIHYLLTNTRIEVNALNAHGYTPLDVLSQSRRDIKDLDIADSIRSVGGLRAIEMQSAVPGIGPIRTRFIPITQSGPLKKSVKAEDWLTRKRDSLMVVASLIATTAFQAGLTPPAGLWQDDSISTSPDGSTEQHVAGTSILAYHDLNNYALYLYYNTTSLIASLSIILLLITGLPFKRRLFMWILIVIVWMAITSMALTYRVSVLVFTPKQNEKTVSRVIQFALVVWCIVMAVLFVGHTIRVAANLFNKIGVRKRRLSLSAHSVNG